MTQNFLTVPKVGIVILGFAALLLGGSSPAHAINIPIAPPRAVTPAEQKFQEGIAALKNNDLSAAETAFKESIKLDSKAAGPYMGLAQVALRRGQKDVAAANMKQAVALAPQSASIQTSWGTYLYTQRDLPAAEAALRKAVSLDSNDMAAHLHLGDMYLVAFQKPDDAIKEYRAAVQAAPAYAGAHYALGLALLTKDQLLEGESELRTASQLLPTNPLPHHVLGRMYEEQKQYDKALREFDAALTLAPAFAAAHFERGQIFAAKGDDARALAEYTEVQKADPKRSVGYTNIGMLHQRNKRWAQAQDAYLSAVKIDPGNAVAYNNLAWMTAERKADLTRGLEWANKAIALSPNVPEFQVTLAWVYRANGDLPRAEQTLRKASTLKPQRASVFYYLGRVYLDQGKKEAGATEIKKALSLQPDFVGADEARKTLKELGQG